MKVLVMTAMYPTPENPAFGSFVRTQVESLRRGGVDIDLLVLDGHPRKLIYPKGVVQLRRRLRRAPVDLVHAHYSYVGMVARTQWEVPVVVTFHGSDILGEVKPDGRTTAFSRVMAAAGRATARLADAAIVQSEEMARAIPGANVRIIPHEVDFDLFRPTDRSQARALLGLAPEKKYLLFAAHPDNPVKRFPLAKAAADALSEHDPDVELLVVYKETQDRLALYMSACDALVFPSFSEGSPNVVKQAMACNLPIVATDVGDVRQVIGNTEHCYVCSPRVDEFARRLKEILQCPPRTTGREAVRRFDTETVRAQVIRLYEETLNRHQPHSAASGQHMPSA